MAEFVQHNIEEMLPEIEEMERIGLFTDVETKKILRKRKAYEYKLRRRTRLKEDYLQYIQYEVSLLSLVKKRRARTRCMFKRLEVDVAIIKRIHRLFKIACFRFRNDVKLWLSHIDFCESLGEKASVGRLYAEMLQVHSRITGLWVMAAKWEMEKNNFMRNARSLLQRSLRFNPSSQHLWREYFRMELLNAEKLTRRKEILQSSHMADDDKEMPDTVLRGDVALVVFHQAVNTFPDDVAFCVSFIPICLLFDMDNIEEEIFSTIQQRYPTHELMFDAVARRHLKGAALDGVEMEEAERCCLQVYDDAVEKTNTEKMWTLYLETSLELAALATSKRRLVEKRVQHCLVTFDRALEQKNISEKLMCNWLEMLSRVGLVGERGRVAELAVTLYPASSPLWLALMTVQTQRDKSDFQLVRSTLLAAAETVPEEECLPLWDAAYKWSLINAAQIVEQILLAGVGQRGPVGQAVKVWYLEWSMINKGAHQTRKLYHRLLAMRPTSMDFFGKFLEIERAQPISKMKKLRRVFEDAVNEFGKVNTGLWCDYIKTERTHAHGNPENAGALYWRAMKALDDDLIEQFVSEHTLGQTD